MVAPRREPRRARAVLRRAVPGAGVRAAPDRTGPRPVCRRGPGPRARQLLLQGLDDTGFIESTSRHDDGDNLLTPLLTWHAKDRGLADEALCAKDFFNFRRVHVYAPADNHAFLAINDRKAQGALCSATT